MINFSKNNTKTSTRKIHAPNQRKFLTNHHQLFFCTSFSFIPIPIEKWMPENPSSNSNFDDGFTLLIGEDVFSETKFKTMACTRRWMRKQAKGDLSVAHGNKLSYTLLWGKTDDLFVIRTFAIFWLFQKKVFSKIIISKDKNGWKHESGIKKNLWPLLFFY